MRLVTLPTPVIQGPRNGGTISMRSVLGAGPTGATGATGATGDTGPQGPPGPGTGAGAWQASTAYTAGQVVQAPDGSMISRNSTGTSGASFDATEKTAWTAVLGKSGTVEADALSTSIAQLKQWARNPDMLITGAITRDSNGAATSAPVTWPDGVTGTYTADTLSTAFPGAVDAYHVTYVGATTKTFTQPAVTRDATTGAVTDAPAITVS